MSFILPLFELLESFSLFQCVTFLIIRFTTVIGFEKPLIWFIDYLPVLVLGLIAYDCFSEFRIHLCPNLLVSFQIEGL